MSSRNPVFGKASPSSGRGYDFLAIARLRRMIALGESLQERRNFADAIRRLEAGPARPGSNDPAF